MSDWGAVHSTEKAALAGLEQQSGYPFDDAPYFGAPLRAAVVAGRVPRARLDEMATRILRPMFAHGLVDDPVPASAPIDYVAHAAVTQADAEQGIVLLKNQGDLLPLGGNVHTIVVIGSHADKGVLAGGGSSLVYPRGGNAVPGIEPTQWPGPSSIIHRPRCRRSRLCGRTIRSASLTAAIRLQAAAEARAADIVIVFAHQWTGKSFDTPLALPEGQDALIEAVIASNPRTAVVLETAGRC